MPSSEASGVIIATQLLMDASRVEDWLAVGDEDRGWHPDEKTKIDAAITNNARRAINSNSQN